MLNKKNYPKIKLVFVAPSLDVGGAERFLIDLLKNLDQSLFVIKLVLFSHAGPGVIELAESGIEVRVLKKRFKFDPVNFWQLYRVLKDFQPDIVHTQLGGDFYGRFLAHYLKTKVIISTEVSMNKDEGWLMNKLKSYTAVWASQIVAVSRAVQKDITRRYRVAPEKITLIPNGIEIQKFPARTSLPIGSDGGFTIGSLGRLAPEKNFSTLIKALDLMRHREVRCLVAGEGSLRPELEKLIKDLKLESRVQLVGIRPAAEFLPTLDIFVLPSNWEAFGIVLLEAGAVGVPIIASEVDGILDIIDETTGQLFNPHNPPELAQKIDEILDNLQEPIVTARTKKLQAKIQANFSLAIVASKYQSLYLKLYQAE